MNRAIEFHDSVIESVKFIDDFLVVIFSEAYIHESEGKPGVAKGDGYVQPLLLRFTAAKSKISSEATGSLSDAIVIISGVEYSMLPVPFTTDEELTAEFKFTNGHCLQVSAAGMQCIANGQAKWVESYRGAKHTVH